MKIHENKLYENMKIHENMKIRENKIHEYI